MDIKNAEQRLIISLEDMPYRRAIHMARILQGKVWGFKLTDILAERGSRVIPVFKRYGNVFADRKIYQIPSTLANIISKDVEAGADFATVPIDVGEASLVAACENARGVKILGVTVLTCMSEREVRDKYNYVDLGFPDYAIAEEVLRQTRKAIRCGLDGIVCAPVELAALQELNFPKGFLRVVPNIRMPEQEIVGDDQNIARSATPYQAIQLGATHIVVGRPIMRSKNPIEVVEAMLKDLNPSV